MYEISYIVHDTHGVPMKFPALLFGCALAAAGDPRGAWEELNTGFAQGQR
jgi:hypothetical protein